MNVGGIYCFWWILPENENEMDLKYVFCSTDDDSAQFPLLVSLAVCPGGKNSVPTIFRSERAKKMSGKNSDLETARFPHIFLAISQSERAKKIMRKFLWNSLGITLCF